MLSVCILTKNSQDEIGRLLPTLTFADQILIVDDYSDDNTQNVAVAHKCSFYKRHLNNDFAGQRNYGLKKAKGEWVLFLDTDEFVSKELAQEIQRTVKSAKHDGYDIKREDVFLKKTLKYGETKSIWLTRLAKKSAGLWIRPVHEVWQVENTAKLNNSLQHFSHVSIKAFIKKINYYTSIEAEYRNSHGQKTTVAQAIYYPIAKFMQNYILRLGFLDGFEGFVMSVIMSTHSFLVRAKMLTTK